MLENSLEINPVCVKIKTEDSEYMDFKVDPDPIYEQNISSEDFKIEQSDSSIQNDQDFEQIKTESRKSAKCEQCDKIFSRQKDLRRHISTVHDGVKKHKCEKCDKGFTTKHALTYHLQGRTKVFRRYPISLHKLPYFTTKWEG